MSSQPSPRVHLSGILIGLLKWALFVILIGLLAGLLFSPAIARGGGQVGEAAGAVAARYNNQIMRLCPQDSTRCPIAEQLGYRQPVDIAVSPVDIPVSNPGTILNQGVCGGSCDPGEWCIAGNIRGRSCTIWCVDQDHNGYCERFRCYDGNDDHVCDLQAWVTCADSGPQVNCSDHFWPRGSCSDGLACLQEPDGEYLCWADQCSAPPPPETGSGSPGSSTDGTCGSPCSPGQTNACTAGLSCEPYSALPNGRSTYVCWGSTCMPGDSPTLPPSAGGGSTGPCSRAACQSNADCAAEGPNPICLNGTCYDATCDTSGAEGSNDGGGSSDGGSGNSGGGPTTGGNQCTPGVTCDCSGQMCIDPCTGQVCTPP